MKPKEYVKKYKMNEGKFNHNSFVADFTIDFMSLIEFHHNANWNLTKFNNCVNDMRAKWDGISSKVAGGISESLWKYFYATVVVKVREEYCGPELEARQRKWEERKQEQDQWRQFNSGFDPWTFLFGQLLNDLLKGSKMMVPIESFQTLDLPQESSSEEVKKKFKELAFKHHPDHGGNVATFRTIVEAKNRCLAYIG